MIPSTTQTDKSFPWRMQQPDSQRKYQLFPRERQLPVLNSGKSLDPEKAFALAMSQTGAAADKQSATAGLRIRISQHNLVRRRKVSVPEIGPMTTVQEVPMDSPTIPGRPPLHERSISAPGNSLRKHQLADTFLCMSPSDDGSSDILSAVEDALQRSSSKHLPPLVIPSRNSPSPQLRHQLSHSHFRSGSDGLRTTRIDQSPRSRTPFTPNTSISDLSTPMSASTNIMSCSTLPTPISAPIMESQRSSPKPWDGRCTTPVSADAITPARGHRRGASESSNSSIMDRGRPRKRSEVRNNNGPLLKRVDSKRSKSAERKAFEHLPKGHRIADAAANIESSELAKLQKQAFGQVERFEVLRTEDVESLSKELRHLDERTEYLRRTYNSLRTGRRNLHSRICQYLRSPRVAKFSHDSMLKQEEALAELDASIDDWVIKLEQADNRRTRVRQKLLEHVAAAACLSVSNASSVASELPQQAVAGLSGVGNISTPPRSPLKQTFTSVHTASNSPSPQRVVAQVPSTIFEDPAIEDVAGLEKDERLSTASLRRSDVESIRIYAGDDVYALLADVENEITKMSSNVTERVSEEEMPEPKRIQIHRQKSHEMLSGLIDGNTTKKEQTPTRPLSPPAPTPPLKDEPVEEGLILLTNAVFKP
ncbi:Fc.00g102590.m01.CDS01 [Cosmosporella sp. VM-42]